MSPSQKSKLNFIIYAYITLYSIKPIFSVEFFKKIKFNITVKPQSLNPNNLDCF